MHTTTPKQEPVDSTVDSTVEVPSVLFGTKSSLTTYGYIVGMRFATIGNVILIPPSSNQILVRLQITCSFVCAQANSRIGNTSQLRLELCNFHRFTGIVQRSTFIESFSRVLRGFCELFTIKFILVSSLIFSVRTIVKNGNWQRMTENERKSAVDL